MKISPKKYDVGYGRPPVQTRWKKGQCGNPKRKRERLLKTEVEMIDEFFAGKVEIVEKGISRRVTNFEAIITQLWIKAVTNNQRAMNVFLKYQRFAASRRSWGDVEVEVIHEGSESRNEK